MPLENAQTINQLVATNPVATDPLAQADDHLRLIKSTIQNTFPNVTGAINATHTEMNSVADGDTAATATTLVDADRVVVNDDGTMKQVAMTDVQTYVDANMTLRDDVVTAASVADDAINTANIVDGAVTAAKLAVGAAFVAGMVMPYAGSAAPSGWLLAYGQDVSRTTYSGLFSAIGTTYGSGDGSTTFTLPDLRGRTVAGQDNMGGTSADRLTNQTGGLNGDTLGATGGSETHTLTEAELAAHSHSLGENGRVQVGNDNGVAYSGSWSSGSGGLITYSTEDTGSDTAHNNVQPTIILNYIIKT
jgi:microcystin-dependent protein